MHDLLPRAKSGTPKAFALVFFVLAAIGAVAQPVSLSKTVKWYPVSYTQIAAGDSVGLLSFEGSLPGKGELRGLPLFSERVKMPSADAVVGGLRISQEKYAALTAEERAVVTDPGRIPTEITLTVRTSLQRKLRFQTIDFPPLRKNPQTGVLEKLVSFRLGYEILEGDPQKARLKNYATHSVLAEGTWVKMGISASGIYRLTYSDFQSLGFDPGSIDPRNIRVYSNDGGMLPESNETARIDDLRECSIQVAGEEDGQFNSGDYILFYAKGPDTWSGSTSSQYFRHQKNLYSSLNYAFITVGSSPGKRVTSQPSSALPADQVITTFNDFAFYEKDEKNLIKSGREWYDGDLFDLTTTRNYSFSFPDLNVTTPVGIRTVVAARSTAVPTAFTVSANSQQVMTVQVPPTSENYLAEFARERTGDGTYTASGPVVEIRLAFNKNGDEAIGYLNYLELNVTRNLRFSGGLLSFRSVAGVGKDKISEFRLSNAGSSVVVWQVTDPGNILRIGTTLSGDQLSFRVATDTLHEFVAFDGSSFLSIQSHETIENQDLHGITSCDYLIITHPYFMTEANRVADFHRQHNGYNVFITTPGLIYNEFSSGAQDITAIRDFVRMLYDKAEAGNEPRYLLLLGDASYDYKDLTANNTNFVPTYESAESLDPVETYVTDDYFGLLDSDEGANCTGDLDIGIGRFPVASIEEARSATDKIIHYASESDTVKNDWRNIVCFVADDEDSNLHLSQAEELADYIGDNHPVYNLDKIYLDAYKQVSTPGGARYPDVNTAINLRVNKGALIINYVGHGGELGWAHERVLEIPDIKSWQNYDNMPVFLTATCEFSRFDDPGFVCAGEWVYLNPNGGGIALFTTTRPTFAGSNFSLTTNFYHHVFERIDGAYPKMGDLIVVSKNATGTSANTRKFVLLGDPGLELSYPDLNVTTTSVNGHPLTLGSDTLKALSVVTITGEIKDALGNKVSSFNGTVFPTVFDKPAVVQTLANDDGTPVSYLLQKNIIYKGKVDVTAGGFSYSFIVPKDISYQFGFGKISYYARSADDDANGFNDEIVVGGYNDSAPEDNVGPVIRLFMNDTNFRNGGITSQNPVLLATVFDESGINTVGSGIGHDLTAVLDNQDQDLYILNDYYIADKNTFASGSISYPFLGLADGYHDVRLKVWDVYNNSSEATLSFLVVSSAEFAVQKLMNYPNPFHDHTTFSFEYNQPANPLNIEIRIYDMNGNLVRTLSQRITTDSFRANEVQWDGTDEKGAKIATGLYVYRLTVSLEGSGAVEKSSKLVFVR